jgi:hypothetical protein
MAIHQQTDSLSKAGETPDSNPVIAGQQSGPMSGLFYILSLWRFFFHGRNFHRLCFYTLQYSWSKLSSNSIIRNLYCISVLYGLSCESISYAVRSNFFSGSSFTVLHVHATYPYFIDLLHVNAACSCCMPLLHVLATCPCAYSFCMLCCIPYCMSTLKSPCCMSKVHFKATCPSFIYVATPCCMTMLHVRASCTYCMSMLHVRAICTYWMSFLYFNAACTCCIFPLILCVACSGQ